MEFITDHWLRWFLLALAVVLVFSIFHWGLPAIKKAAAKLQGKTGAPAPAVAATDPVVEHTIAAENPAPGPAAAQAVRVDTPAAKAIASAGSSALPNPWMPAEKYDNSLQLFLAVKANDYSQIVRLDGIRIWPDNPNKGFGPGADYSTQADGKVKFGIRSVDSPAKPDPQTPAPEPAKPEPTKPAEPAPVDYLQTLTDREMKAGVLVGPAYGLYAAKADGELFPSHAARAEWVSQVLRDGTSTAPPIDPNQTPTVDTRAWTHANWYSAIFDHPEYLRYVENTVYNRQQINAHSTGGQFYIADNSQRPSEKPANLP